MKPGSEPGPDLQEWKRIFYTSAHTARHTTSSSYIHIMIYAFHILLFCIRAENGEVPANEAFLWPVSKSLLTSQISMSLHASHSLMHNPGLQRQRHHPCDHTVSANGEKHKLQRHNSLPASHDGARCRNYGDPERLQKTPFVPCLCKIYSAD